jgi:hypothetical protein
MNGSAHALRRLTDDPVMPYPDRRWTAGDVPAATYEVDDAAGRCLYRGTDLELACDVHDHDPGARLFRLAAAGAR